MTGNYWRITFWFLSKWSKVLTDIWCNSARLTGLELKVVLKLKTAGLRLEYEFTLIFMTALLEYPQYKLTVRLNIV